MPRYWAIAPFQADKPELWEKVWKYDLDHGIITIGWNKLGDLSSLSESQLSELIDRTYSDKVPAAKKHISGIFRNFYHSIKPGDIIIARRGLKKIAAIGTVTRAAYYKKNENVEVLGPDKAHPNCLDVQWADTTRNKSFDTIVFGMQTLTEIPEEKFRVLTQTEPPPPVTETSSVEAEVQNQAEFVLEKYLEEFIVSNFDTIFKGKLRLYYESGDDASPDEGAPGQQFETDDVGTIDILAQEIPSNAFVVIELKKGRESDKVVGQVLRYMGWVAENLCQQGQDVKGMIICKEPDPRLTYAIRMAKGVSLKYYRVNFKLQDHS